MREADLIAWDRDTLVIVEVKSRASRRFRPPGARHRRRETRHLLRVAASYAARTDTPWERVRFDVVTVLLTNPPQIMPVSRRLLNTIHDAEDLDHACRLWSNNSLSSKTYALV